MGCFGSSSHERDFFHFVLQMRIIRINILIVHNPTVYDKEIVMNQIRSPHTLFGVDAPRPVSVPTTELEWLLIRAYRSWVNGLKDGNSQSWNVVWSDFLAEFGTKKGKLALVWFVRIINTLLNHAERSLGYHHPGCPCIGEDERRIIAVIAACQHGQALVARDTAIQIVAPDGVGDLIAASSQLGLLLSECRPSLPLRENKRDRFDLSTMTAMSAEIN